MLGYRENVDKYEIRFEKTKKQKQVTRINLRFKRESAEEFDRQLEIADFYRKRSEIFM